MEPEKTPRERAEDLLSLLVPDWRPTSQQVLWAIRIAIVLSLLVAIGYSYDITLWDWLKLLIVPAAIAAGGLWFNSQQQERQQEDNQRQQARELYIAEQRAQDEALQAFLEGMSQLLTDKEQPLHRAQAGDSLSTVARARTLTVLGSLDGGRKGSVIQFLYESGLISKASDHFGGPIVNLDGADLSGADLYGTYLIGAVLGTYPAGRDVSAGFVVRTNLRGANLGVCDLKYAELGYTDLDGATFNSSDLYGANLYQASLVQVSFQGAHLRRTNLQDAQPAEEADFTYAVGKTNEEIEQEVGYLEGATMPNGQKYEDWLKSTGREENGKNE